MYRWVQWNPIGIRWVYEYYHSRFLLQCLLIQPLYLLVTTQQEKMKCLMLKFGYLKTQSFQYLCKYIVVKVDLSLLQQLIQTQNHLGSAVKTNISIYQLVRLTELACMGSLFILQKVNLLFTVGPTVLKQKAIK